MEVHSSEKRKKIQPKVINHMNDLERILRRKERILEGY